LLLFLNNKFSIKISLPNLPMNHIHRTSNTLGLVIVDGVGFKNFILSSFISTVLKEFDKIIIYSGLPVSCYKEIESEKILIIELPIFIESQNIWFWRKMKEVAHMQQHKKRFFGIASNLEKNRPSNRSRRGLLISLIFKLTSIFNSEKWISAYYSMQVKNVRNHPVFREYQNLLSNFNGQVLLFTHQRPPYLLLLDVAAKALDIKTCAFIFSWDNLPSKGRMAAPFNSFLVWSELMKTELEYFYPDIKGKSIEVVGTPQFEPYVMNEYYSTKKSFIHNFNLNNELKTVCYSCGDESTSKNDSLYIEIIAQAIIDNEIEHVNLIVRTSPAEDGSRFKEIQKRYPFIIWNFPKWDISRKAHPEPWSQRVPYKQDLIDLRSLLQYCDLNINMCSTMSLDFMIFDKPVINPVFGTGKNGLYDDQKYLRYSHYVRVVESGAVAVVKNKHELIEEINFSLSNPQYRLHLQRELLKLQIGKPLVETSSIISKAVKEL
jgi:hypothetical protein